MAWTTSVSWSIISPGEQYGCRSSRNAAPALSRRTVAPRLPEEAALLGEDSRMHKPRGWRTGSGADPTRPPGRRDGSARRLAALRATELLDAPAEDPFGVSLAGIDLAVRAGEVVGIAGISGNGQAELARLLSGEDRIPSARRGAIRMMGRPAGHLGPAARRVGDDDAHRPLRPWRRLRRCLAGRRAERRRAEQGPTTRAAPCRHAPLPRFLNARQHRQPAPHPPCCAPEATEGRPSWP